MDLLLRLDPQQPARAMCGLSPKYPGCSSAGSAQALPAFRLSAPFVDEGRNPTGGRPWSRVIPPSSRVRGS
jgi:hypothetical protein